MNLQQTLSLVALGLAAAKTRGKIEPKVLGFIETAEHAVQSALAAAQQAKTGVDPSNLKSIDPVA
jgi:hypothetical protein